MKELNHQLAHNFLERNNLQNCNIVKIAGDASFRSYYRIFCEQNKQAKNYILMFAPKDLEEITPFIKIDKILLENGFNAPKIIAQDNEIAFLLLEDFGDGTYTKVLQQDLTQEFDLYKKACDILINLHKIPTHNLDIPKYNNAILYREVALFLDWYLPYKNHKISLNQVKNYKNIWFNLFDKLSKDNQVIVLRDYHADNLMFLPNKEVGLLDFQDALIGSCAYDLLSLLEDARRDLNQDNREKLFDYFVSKANYNREQFLIDYEIISLQRNIKILGIFARLFLRDNKSQYLNYLPRVEKFVRNRIAKTSFLSLADGTLANDFKEFLNKYL